MCKLCYLTDGNLN